MLNACLDVLAEMEAEARERAEEAAAAAAGNEGAGGGGCGHVRGTGSGHLHGLEVKECAGVYVCVWGGWNMIVEKEPQRAWIKSHKTTRKIKTQAEAYEEELLEDLMYAEGGHGHGHGHGHAGSTYAPHPLVQALVAAHDAVARVDLRGCLQGGLGAARWVRREGKGLVVLLWCIYM